MTPRFPYHLGDTWSPYEEDEDELNGDLSDYVDAEPEPYWHCPECGCVVDEDSHCPQCGKLIPYS